MSRIITIGEAAYDILFRNKKPFDGKVGGAIINTSVSLARLGLNVCLVGDAADDEIGSITIDFLLENNIDVSHFKLYPNARSRIALAFIDQPNKPEFLFYKLKSEQEILLDFPVPSPTDIIVFGSFYAIKPEVKNQITVFLRMAKKIGSLLVYDPNFRKNNQPYLEPARANIDEYIRLSDIIKGSDEDFRLIFGLETFEDVCKKFNKHKNKCIFYTQGKDPVLASIFGEYYSFPINEVKAISAVGAGDSFNAGLVYMLLQLHDSLQSLTILSSNDWKKIVAFASELAANVCMTHENYISNDFAKQLRSKA